MRFSRTDDAEPTVWNPANDVICPPKSAFPTAEKLEPIMNTPVTDTRSSKQTEPVTHADEPMKCELAEDDRPNITVGPERLVVPITNVWDDCEPAESDPPMIELALTEKSDPTKTGHLPIETPLPIITESPTVIRWLTSREALEVISDPARMVSVTIADAPTCISRCDDREEPVANLPHVETIAPKHV